MPSWDGTGGWLCEESWQLSELTGCDAGITNILCELQPSDRAGGVTSLAIFHENFPLEEMPLDWLRMIARTRQLSEKYENVQMTV
jgi:hypothetical protein